MRDVKKAQILSTKNALKQGRFYISYAMMTILAGHR